MFDRPRLRHSTLIVGTSTEASLVASLLGASKHPKSDHLSYDLSSPIWIDSISKAEEHILRESWNEVVLDNLRSREELGRFSVLPRRVTTARGKLERYFGRVATSSIPDEMLEHARPKPLLWRIGEVILALCLLVPALIAISLFWVAFQLCGVRRVFQRSSYVGRNQEEILVSVIAPETTPKQSSASLFLAKSLGRQVNRLHLTNTLGLFNVIRGEMNIVGPSLILTHEYESAAQKWPALRLRTLVRPGLISLARARLGTTYATHDLKRALEYDLYYIKHRTPQLDLRVILRVAFGIVRDILSTIFRIGSSALRLIAGALFGRFNVMQGSAARFVVPSMPPGLERTLKPVLVVGAGSGGEQLIRSLQENTSLGFWPVAVVDDNLGKLGTQIHGVPVLGSTESLSALVVREGVEEIVIALPSAGEVDRQRITEKAQATGKPVHSIPSLQALLRGVASTNLVDVQPSDLLGRSVVEIDPAGARDLLQNRRVLITGAAGSIGSEVVIQALRGQPSTIYGLDINESDLYDLQQSLKRETTTTTFVPIVGSLTDSQLVRSVMDQFRPDVVFHAGAYKHVPLMETYPREALKTNINGTFNIVSASAEFGVERFVMVSTDKAVRPSSVMGASKRIAELIVREVGTSTGLSTCSVRFGNVLGSRGSVIPLFKKQIEKGGPVTVTDEGMTRYFMTIPEAAGLIIEAGAIGDRNVVYMLDMDEPVRIVDVAERLIRLQGLRPGEDIKIEFTGLRPGEKLFEELSLDFEEARPTRHPKVRVLHGSHENTTLSVTQQTQRLMSLVDNGDPEDIREEILHVISILDAEPVATTALASAHD